MNNLFVTPAVYDLMILSCFIIFTHLLLIIFPSSPQRIKVGLRYIIDSLSQCGVTAMAREYEK
jgi:hypothetical protein